MKISNKGGSGTFIPHPPTIEPVRAVCVDVTPLELAVTGYGPKNMFKIVFETETEKEDGERFCVWSRRFTPSLNEKASLRAFLKMMFGEDVAVTKADARGDIDPEELCLGFPVKLMIVHEENDGNTYANISTIFPDRSSAPLKPSGNFTRKKDRPDRPERDGAASGHQGAGKPALAGDWKTAIIPSGTHKGKRLEDLDAQQLQDFINSYLAWFGGKSTSSPAQTALAAACRAAKTYLEDLEDDIPF